MTTEDYCSYELSQLLKEKGFEGVCEYAYSNKGNYFEIDRSNFDEVYCLRPTHQMAMAWLREKGWHIEISLTYDDDEKACYYVLITNIKTFIGKDTELDDKLFYTYEDAVEAALKYSLENLI